jgi:beta-glucosidase
MAESFRFPEGFRWGVATASWQVEGAVNEGGRKPSVWDAFCRRPGAMRTGETGDQACDHYHRYESDIALMASLGIRHYRLSIAWPRIVPDGRGAVNEAGVDFYKRLLDCMRRHGITPHVTLFHWDSPQALDERYGSWRSREIADDFADYVTAVVKRLGDRVDSWMTINELPCYTVVGYDVGKPGYHAPGGNLATRKEVWQTVHHALLAHGRGVQAIRAATPRPCRVAIADCPGTTVPATESPADIAAAGKAYHDFLWNGAVTFPMLTGRYSDAFLADKGSRGEVPDIRPGDMEIIHQPLDAVGLNIYSGSYVRAAANDKGYEILDLPEGYPRLDISWLNVVPDSIYWALRHVRDQCGWRGEEFISENGAACRDQLNQQGECIDLDRILYLRTYLRQVHRAVAEGIPVTGYFQWTFTDNFEWTFGTSKRVGLVYNVFESQQRIPKLSAKWYSEVIRQNRVV